MEIEVLDTSSTAVYEFYIYAELTRTPNINGYTNKGVITVVCGSESVTLGAGILQNNQIGAFSIETLIDFKTQSLANHFLSSKADCPVT